MKRTTYFFLLFLLLSRISFTQNLTGESLTILKSDGTNGGDNTFLKRYDEINDRTKLRLNMGDEYTSNFEIGYHHYNGTGWYTNFSLDGYGNGFFQGSLGIGTTTPTYKLSVNGTIGAKEIKVTSSGWSDFVFEPDYDLPSLQEVETFIDQNGHLPDIPSAEEVKANGISLGEIDAKLLQKIEELTLYVIELKKENEDLKAKGNEIDELKEMVQQLLGEK
jgi:hypothetical protein